MLQEEEGLIRFPMTNRSLHYYPSILVSWMVPNVVSSSFSIVGGKRICFWLFWYVKKMRQKHVETFHDTTKIYYLNNVHGNSIPVP